MKKFLMVFFLILPIAIFLMYKDRNSVLDLELNGYVTDINWKSNNHAIPLIKVNSTNGIKSFHSSRIILNSNNLKVGDYLIKEKGEKSCNINGSNILCIK